MRSLTAAIIAVMFITTTTLAAQREEPKATGSSARGAVGVGAVSQAAILRLGPKTPSNRPGQMQSHAAGSVTQQSMRITPPPSLPDATTKP